MRNMDVMSLPGGNGDTLVDNGNCYPMGREGKEERWREAVVDLDRRWLLAGNVPAEEMTMADGGPLRAEVRPTNQHRRRRTGAEAALHMQGDVTALLQEYPGTKHIRLTCAAECRNGNLCHGENRAALIREWMDVAETQNGAPTTSP